MWISHMYYVFRHMFNLPLSFDHWLEDYYFLLGYLVLLNLLYMCNADSPCCLTCICFREDHGHHEHESYYGDRDTETLVQVQVKLVLNWPFAFIDQLLKPYKIKVHAWPNAIVCFFQTMEGLVAAIPLENQRLALEDKSNATKRPAPLTGGCRIEGYVRVKKVIITILD